MASATTSGQTVQESTRSQDQKSSRRDYRPVGTDRKASTFGSLKRTLTEFSQDNLTDWAAAMTYYGLLAMFPAIIAFVSVVGLVADPKKTTDALTQILTTLAPGVVEPLQGTINSIAEGGSAAGIAVITGLLGALWSASGYVGAFMRACAIIFETPEGRPIWKLRPLQMFVTLVMVVLTAVVALSLVATGPVVDAIAGPLGIGSAAVTAWNIAKWPVLVLIVLVMISFMYYASPNVKLRGFKWVMPGALLAVVVWVIASVGFAFFVANFGSYNKTYGAMAGVIVFLIWLWLTNVAILLGAEFNSERERSLELGEGVAGADKELQLEPRDEPKDRLTN